MYYFFYEKLKTVIFQTSSVILLIARFSWRHWKLQKPFECSIMSFSYKLPTFQRNLLPSSLLYTSRESGFLHIQPSSLPEDGRSEFPENLDSNIMW